jgi:hypothetical protein
MVRLVVTNGSGLKFYLLKESPIPRRKEPSPDKSKIRLYTNEVLDQLAKMGHICTLFARCSGRTYTFVSTTISEVTGSRSAGFFKLYRRRFRLCHARKCDLQAEEVREVIRDFTSPPQATSFKVSMYSAFRPFK